MFAVGTLGGMREQVAALMLGSVAGVQGGQAFGKLLSGTAGPFGVITLRLSLAGSPGSSSRTAPDQTAVAGDRLRHRRRGRRRRYRARAKAASRAPGTP